MFGDFSDVDIRAAGGALEYVYLTQKEALPHLQPPQKIKSDTFLQIDAASRRSLELSSTQSGAYKNSLLFMIDHTSTAGGQRLLSHTLAFPLVDPSKIKRRYDQIDFFIKNAPSTQDLKPHLKEFPDGERALARLSSNRGSARDLLVIRQVLKEGMCLYQHLQSLQAPFEPLPFKLEDLVPLYEELLQALKDEVGALTRDGGFVRPNYDSALDHLQNYEQESKKALINQQKIYTETTGIPSLKIKHNQVIGYYIEVTQTHKDKVPETFIHRQSLMNSHRYTTPELLAIQEKLVSAQGDALCLELEIFDRLVGHVLEQQNKLRPFIHGISHIDMMHGLAHLANTHGYVRPELTEDTSFDVKKGRHPTVEILLKQKNELFVENSCQLNQQKNVVLLTGPNMGGKSTYLRQNALIIVLAQMGSFVPATAAKIGLVDRIFSRVGAGDDLTRGRSTFMMEMIETATILHQATEKSFVILDEVGRSTSTFDGLAIAQATVEALHQHNKCRTLFATHYHELTNLEDTLDRLKCMAVQVKEWEGTIVLLHAISEGNQINLTASTSLK
ncbi:MAG: DNA mismatch repair protein MutS [Holosporaceae bacterium]|nr:MAG: DNA mismatch repair protein MutS [Holosporaceae bacterium]